MAVTDAQTEAGPVPDFRVGRAAQRSPSGRVRAASELAALMRVSAAAADAYRLEDVMEQAAEAALEVTGAASLSISKWERERDVMRTMINVGDLGTGEERLPADEVYPLEEYPLVARLLRDGEPYYSDVDDPDAPQTAVDLLRSYGKESELAVPIFLDSAVWGEVWATTAAGARRFDADDATFMQAIADRLALVLSRAERYSKVSRLAYEDPLTGLANRRAIEERLEMLLDQPRRGPLTLLLCDVDGLKDINDAHGHYVGDRALCRVGEALVAAAAAAPLSAPFVGRLGGDEFCVLLEGLEPQAPSALAAAALEILAGGDDLSLSLSFGAATATARTTAAELLHAADGAQYTAKRRGGGRLCTAEGDEAWDGIEPRRRSDGRMSIEEQLERTALDVVGLLDADLASRPAVDRIEAVVGAFSGALDVAAWVISSWEHGSPVLHTVSTADDRASRLRGERVELEHRDFRLADYPQTAELLRSGNGAFLVRAEDADGDPAETALLRELGFSAGLMVAVSHGARSYLVELYTDARTLDLTAAMARLVLLLRIAAVATRST